MERKVEQAQESGFIFPAVNVFGILIGIALNLEVALSSISSDP